MNRFYFLAGLLFIASMTACSSRSVLPDTEEVKVSREAPSSKNCREMGVLTGRVASTQGTQEQALADLKREAANKGANYVVVKQYSDLGTAVTGLAYECK